MSCISCSGCGPEGLILLGEDDEKSVDEEGVVGAGELFSEEPLMTPLTTRSTGVFLSGARSPAAKEKERKKKLKKKASVSWLECGAPDCGVVECGAEELVAVDDDEDDDDDEDEVLEVTQVTRRKKRRKSHFAQRRRSEKEGHPIVPDADEFGFFPMPTAESRAKRHVYSFVTLAQRQHQWRQMVATRALQLEEREGGPQYSMWFRSHDHAPLIDSLLHRHDGLPRLDLDSEDVRATIESLQHKEQEVVRAEWDRLGASALLLAQKRPVLDFETRVKCADFDAPVRGARAGSVDSETSGPEDDGDQKVNFSNAFQRLDTLHISKFDRRETLQDQASPKQATGRRESPAAGKHSTTPSQRQQRGSPARRRGFDTPVSSTESAATTAKKKKLARRRKRWRSFTLPPAVQQALDIAEAQRRPDRAMHAYTVVLGRIFIHPDLGEHSYPFAMILRRLAKLQLGASNYQPAVENLQLCLWIYEDNLGVDAVEVARVMNDYAVAAIAQFQYHKRLDDAKMIVKDPERARGDRLEWEHILDIAEDMYSRSTAILLAHGGTILNPQVQSVVQNLASVKNNQRNKAHYKLLNKLMAVAYVDNLRREHKDFVRTEAKSVRFLQDSTKIPSTVQFLEQAQSQRHQVHPQHGALWQNLADIKKAEYLERKARNDILIAGLSRNAISHAEKKLLLTEEELKGTTTTVREEEVEHIEPSLAFFCRGKMNPKMKTSR